MIRTFSTLGCVDLSLEETLALARRHGISAVEVRGLGGELDLPAYFERTYGTPERLAAACAAAPGRILALDTSFRLLEAKEEDRRALEAFVPWAEALGGVPLRVFDGGSTLTDDELAAGVAELERWAAQQRAHGWRTPLMIETHDALVSTERVQRFLSAAPPDTRLLWDAHHTWFKGGEDPVATWRAIRPAVTHVHVKDSVDRPSERHPFTYVLPGDGRFPMAQLRQALEADGYAGPLSLEWERKWHPYLAPLDDALTAAATRDWW